MGRASSTSGPVAPASLDPLVRIHARVPVLSSVARIHAAGASRRVFFATASSKAETDSDTPSTPRRTARGRIGQQAGFLLIRLAVAWP